MEDYNVGIGAYVQLNMGKFILKGNCKMKGLKKIFAIVASVAMVGTSAVSAFASSGVSTEPCPYCGEGSVVYETIDSWPEYTGYARSCTHGCMYGEDYFIALVEVWRYDCSDCYATWTEEVETGWVWECNGWNPQ